MGRDTYWHWHLLTLLDLLLTLIEHLFSLTDTWANDHTKPFTRVNEPKWLHKLPTEKPKLYALECFERIKTQVSNCLSNNRSKHQLLKSSFFNYWRWQLPYSSLLSFHWKLEIASVLKTEVNTINFQNWITITSLVIYYSRCLDWWHDAEYGTN